MICDDGGVSAALRRLLLVLAMAGSGLLLTQVPAQACLCGGQGIQAHARTADVVLSGVVERADSGSNRDVYTLGVERIYQGRVDDTSVEVVSTRKFSCGVELRRERPYVLFAREDGTRLTSGGCTGTDRATPAYVADVEQVLGEGTAIPNPPPSQEPAAPEYTRVEESDKPTFTRLAAPGGAMVLLGLLGLILFRKRT